MGKQILRRPSPAMVVAIFALCLAVGGTAVAATKLSKNAVKTKNIKNGAVTESKIAANAVTESKIANGAISPGKLASSTKTIWAETDLGNGQNILRQSGGVTITPVAATPGEAVVNFGTDVSNRAISVTPLLTLGSINAEYARCPQIGCPTSADSPNAIAVFTFISDTGNLVKTGFAVQATP
jgi:hypothetical protein